MTSSAVAAHYNEVKQEGIEERKNSRIFHLRNINNWMKSCLINEAIDLLRADRIYNPKVLDLACGKGGDLPKWSQARVGSVIMTDIADVSIEQAKGRYEESRAEGRCKFEAQFIVLDSCNNDLAPLIDPAFLPVDLVSCQFAFHYSFVNEESARRMLRNAISSLRPGGLFIGTLPDAERIVWAARSAAANGHKWENRVCSVHYDSSTPIDSPPLFGAKFHFSLDQQVNCPEFLAYLPLLVKLAEEEGMELLWEKRFPAAAQDYLKNERSRNLLYRKLKLLPREKDSIVEGEFDHVADLLGGGEGAGSAATLSKSEWEVFSMYITFCFRKKKDSQ